MGIHVPVLLEEAIASLNLKENGTYVDLTLGRAGHSLAILSKIPQGTLIAFDRDPIAIEESSRRIQEAGYSNYRLIRANFADAKAELASLGIEQVDGILADLGVSSPQFDEASRGFSYREEGPLDMRMDPSSPLTAYRIVNTYSQKQIEDILFLYGEEKEARCIAYAICKARQKKPIETTLELSSIILSAKSPKERAKKGHPAKQSFQAIRIAVNGEEEALTALLNDGPALLKEGGRLSIITFMSLDDRLVKQAFRRLTTVEGSRHGPALRPEDIPTPDFELATKKPIAPSPEELERNPRAASAKLRTLIRKERRSQR